MYYRTYFRSLQSIAAAREVYIWAWHYFAQDHWISQKFHFKYKASSTYSLKSYIKFLKKGTIVPHKRTPVGILHQASDWVILADIDSNYCFPLHFAFTQLRPDITIFSNVLRKVILIELTCFCEGNMESWHSTKINKYLALKTTIDSNKWILL